MISQKQAITNPEYFARIFLKIMDKENNTIPFVWNKAQRDFQHNRTGRDIILKARQLGFSTMIQGEIFRRAVIKTSTTLSLAHDNDATQKLRTMADRFYNHFSFGNIKPERHYANASMTSYPEFDSNVYISTAGNKQSGRGGTYTDFHGSEVAFWNDAESIVIGAMQGGSPDVVLESTPNGAQGYFYEKCMEALRGNSLWKLHFYQWWWDNSYRLAGDPITLEADELQLRQKYNLDDSQIRWRRSKRAELGRFFFQEYPEDVLTCFLTSGNGFFGNMENVFVPDSDVKYDPSHAYVAGLDFGQKDFTSLSVFDKTTKKQVDLLHVNNLDWSEIRRRIKGVYDKWNLESILAESNSIGSVNIEELEKIGVKCKMFSTTTETKQAIISNMNEAIHNGGWKLLDIPVQRHEMNTFIASQLPSGAWKYHAQGNGHDDTVISNALALWSAIAIRNTRLVIYN